MKSQVVISILSIVLVLSVIGTMLNPLASEPSNRDNLQPGDFLFVDIYNGWCFYGYWDHVAIYVGEQRFGRDFWAPAVVEATFDAGVTLTTAYAFWERDKPARIAIKRLIDMPGREGIITNAVDYAISQIGKPFDFMPIPPHKIGDGAYYCCELVWRAYKAAGIDLDSNGGLLVLVDDLYYSPRLELAPSQVTICSIE